MEKDQMVDQFTSQKIMRMFSEAAKDILPTVSKTGETSYSFASLVNRLKVGKSWVLLG